jgi:pantothenate kinase
VVVGDFNTSLSPTDRPSKHKINKQILELNETIDQMDLADVYRVFIQLLHNIHSSQQSKIDHIFRHKASLNKYKKIKIIANIGKVQDLIDSLLNSIRPLKKN